MPRLRKLHECPDAANAIGKLQLLLHLDFARGTLIVDVNRSQSLSPPDALLACAKADLAGAPLAGVAHEHPRYSVGYTVSFGVGGRPAAAGASASVRTAGETPDGTAQVVWEVALVRDTPKTGRIVARLQRGTTLRIGPAKDGWYPVKYGESFASDGWVFRGALGR
jgi:hypothetical protein